MTVTTAIRPPLVGPLPRFAAVAVGTGLLALSSYVSVPMVPVPVTLQTLAVTLIGAVLGPRLGTLTVLAWLAEAAAGAPVLQGGAGGLAVLAGSTAGYLWSFPVAAALVGVLAERGWDGRRPSLALAALLIGNAVPLAIGGAWLAALVGASAAWWSGVAPFLLGGALKAALGAAVMRAFPRRFPG